MNNKDIVKRFNTIHADRYVAEEVWDLLERFVYPLGGGKYFQPLNTEGEIEWRRRNIYDDTAVMGADTLAASLNGSLTSPASKWFDFTFLEPALNDDQASVEWLQLCSNKVWDTIQQSNFNLEAAEGYLDLSAFGNMTITQEPIDDLTWKGIQFHAVPLRESYFEEDEEGGPKCYYRLLKWKPSQFIAKFGRENCNDYICSRYDSANSDLIYCVYKDEANKDADTNSVLSKEKRPYQYKYLLRESAFEFASGGYHEMPAYFVRWRRTAGSQWGYGPGHVALSTVLTVNELVKMVLESAEKVIDPVTLVQNRGVLSDLELEAGGQITVKDVDKSIKTYESNARFDVSALQINDLRSQIRRIYYVDQLELKESPAMSATEVMVRYELMNRLLGPTMGRLQKDLLDKVTINTFRQLYRAKQLPEMPDLVKSAGGLPQVEYIGPLNRAQKSDEVAAAERWLGDLSNLSQLMPDLRHVPDPMEVSKYVAKGLNVPAKLSRSPGEVNERIKQEEEMRQQAMAAQMAQQEQGAAPGGQ